MAEPISVFEKIDWKCVFTLPFHVTKESYLQNFQYKIINRSLNCNYNLKKWKIIMNDKCDKCNEVDTVMYLGDCIRGFRFCVWILQSSVINLDRCVRGFSFFCVYLMTGCMISFINEL